MCKTPSVRPSQDESKPIFWPRNKKISTLLWSFVSRLLSLELESVLLSVPGYHFLLGGPHTWAATKFRPRFQPSVSRPGLMLLSRRHCALWETCGNVWRLFCMPHLESCYWHLFRSQGCCTFAIHRTALKMNFPAQNIKRAKGEKLPTPVDHYNLSKTSDRPLPEYALFPLLSLPLLLLLSFNIFPATYKCSFSFNLPKFRPFFPAQADVIYYF